MLLVISRIFQNWNFSYEFLFQKHNKLYTLRRYVFFFFALRLLLISFFCMFLILMLIQFSRDLNLRFFIFSIYRLMNGWINCFFSTHIVSRCYGFLLKWNTTFSNIGYAERKNLNLLNINPDFYVCWNLIHLRSS